jgi:hypothetical protein
LFNKNKSFKSNRYPKGHISSIGINFIHKKNPFIALLWSMFFPGLGYILLGSYIKGYFFITWEIVINQLTHLNTAIFYSLTGQFELAKQVVDNK